MPPRLSKRQQREQDELARLEASTSARPTTSESEPDEKLPALGKGTNMATSAFAALDLGGAQDDSEEELNEQDAVVVKAKLKSKKRKKKGKGAGGGGLLADAATPASSLPSTPSSTKNPAAAEDDSMDEIDKALAELAIREKKKDAGPSTLAPSTARLEPKWQAVKDVFSFDPKFLDSDAELRRFFGSKVISATPTPGPRPGHHPRFANNPHHATSIRRTASYLAQPEPGWSAPAGVLSLVRYEGPEAKADQGDWYTYLHSQTYREAQLGFLEVLQQADGNRLYDVLQAQPYHVDTLMQLSEMNVQQGDLGASSSFLSKALYALSAPLPTIFPSGSFRLPYAKIENRAFFLAIARKVSILVKRGTWRTACEWAKIALGAGGDADPVGMLVFLDFLAPKAKQNSWFLTMLNVLPAAYSTMRLESYPGLAWAKALCLRGLEQEEASEDNTKSTAALKTAILRFPMVVTLLFTSLGGSVPPKLLTHRRAQLDGSFTDKPSYLLSLLSEFYSNRSSPLWKESSTFAWLQKTVNDVAASLDDSSLEDVRIGERLWSQGPWPQGYAPAGVVRAAFISDIPSVRPYLPPSALQATSYSYDPLPPKGMPGATFYDDLYFAPLYASSSRIRRRARKPPVEQLQEQLARLDPAGRAEALRHFQELIEAREADGMPGGLFEDGETDEEDGEGEGDEAGNPAVQNFMGFLAGLVQRRRAPPG